uniref:Translation elongation factor-like protein n=1 Tax=candidate division WOR-3 bacterium TaxID=2052148 RepID=A0A7V3PSB3_UNCW3
MAETKVGVITHYFGKIGVAVVKATDGPIAVGDTIHIKGHSTDHQQVVESLQIEHQPVSRIEIGQEAGMKVSARVHELDQVFKVNN